MANYDFKKIEKKWQDRWENNADMHAVDFHPTKPKYYILYEFYNISGNLHMGHFKGTVPADALARYKRFNGYNVLFPIGGDSFGLPAENAAIKKGINPHDFVENGMKNAMAQSKLMGLSFDWDRTICTSSPDYYKWTQWIFLQLFKHDKAYKKTGLVNFCPNCKTVLSNEDSQNGKCDRCHGDVVQEERSVWYLKMKEYSEKLLDNIDKIDMRENLKEAQRNWIGKSTGVEVNFDIVNSKDEKVNSIAIYTTCIETIYGVTFLVMAPEHSMVDELREHIKNVDQVNEYKTQTTYRSEFDRISDVKSKTGCILDGLYAVNPVNCEKVPIYLADFVLANYGTGAVMAVPTHDQRDYEFAQKFNIPMIQVIEGDVSKQAVEKHEYLAKDSLLMNSGKFSGMPVSQAKTEITQMLVDMKVAQEKVNYKMQDWSYNRQRYWGEPFPIVFCDNCGTVALSEEELPLELPPTDDYFPNEKGDSPLSKIEDWINCKCPKCGGNARRESDTMPNWAGSSWYWIRYVDPHNDKEIANFEKLKYWGSVDCYTGGTEHITRHVLYAFFWQNFLYEIGVVPTRDPFIRKMGSGLILDDKGKKMSKSSTNGVSPLEVIDKYGSDAARLHVHFLGGYEDDTPWTYNGITGITTFLDRVWALQECIDGEEISKKHIYVLNRLIKRVSENYEELKLNTIIAACMSFVKMIREDKYITKEELRIFLILLNPVAPHITSEIYENVFGVDITTVSWPEYFEEYLEEDTMELPVQIKGKLHKVITVNRNISQDDLIEEIKKANIISSDANIKKIIFVPGKIVNIIL